MSQIAAPTPFAPGRPVAATRSVAAGRLAMLVLVVAGTAAAIFFRVHDLDRIGLNSDEAVYTGQAGALAGDQELARYFSPFRAHPLLLQTLLAVVFKVGGVDDGMARIVVALGFGLTSVVLAALLARRLYGNVAAILTLLFLAVVPYHVLLSRQVMLDIPLALFLTACLLAVYKFAVQRDLSLWWLSAPLFGLAVLAKETGVLLAISIAVFLLWSGTYKLLRWRDVAAWPLLAAIVLVPFVGTRLLYGGETTSGYLSYQAMRPPNHEWWYFPVVLWEFLTPMLTIAAAGGILLMIVRRSMADKLLLAWIGVFGVFFQVWPTKLFPYLIAITPALIIAAASAITGLSSVLARLTGAFKPVVVAALTALLIVPVVPRSQEVLARGTESVGGPFETDVEVQDFAGARSAASWIGDHTPEGSVILTIGPSIGNIISFYGGRDWYALSVSSDPRRRNPAYRPIPNPDLAIRKFQIHYAVWDHYSADRSAFYNGRLMRYVRKFSGTPVYSVWLEDGRVRTGRVAPPGVETRVVIYDLVGGNPLAGERIRGAS